MSSSRLAATFAVLVAAMPAAQAAKTVTHKPVYGAIALDRAGGDVGYAVLRRNTNEAKLDALQACGTNACEVVLQFRGECGALAWSPTAGKAGKSGAPAPKYSASRGVTRAEAETKARRTCGAKDCDIKIWACSR
jgi:hypothetical protein